MCRETAYTEIATHVIPHVQFYLVVFIAEAGKVTASDQRTSKVTGSKLCVLNVSLYMTAQLPGLFW